jgi:hypothetical protein
MVGDPITELHRRRAMNDFPDLARRLFVGPVPQSTGRRTGLEPTLGTELIDFSHDAENLAD